MTKKPETYVGISLEWMKKKKKKKIPYRQLGLLRGSSSPFQRFEPARAKPN